MGICVNMGNIELKPVDINLEIKNKNKFRNSKNENENLNDNNNSNIIYNSNSNNIYNEIKKNDSFIKFFEEYYGYFKQFITKEDLNKIGKINKKTMSLILIDKGNYLHLLKESKKKKIKKIISVSK